MTSEIIFAATGAIVWSLLALAALFVAGVYAVESWGHRFAMYAARRLFEDVFIEPEDREAFRYAVRLIKKNAEMFEVNEAWQERRESKP